MWVTQPTATPTRGAPCCDTVPHAVPGPGGEARSVVLEAPGPWPPSAEGSPWRQTMLTTYFRGGSSRLAWTRHGVGALCVVCRSARGRSRHFLPLAASLWCISLVTDSDPCVMRALTVSLGSTAGGPEGGRAGQREESVPLTPGGLAPCSGRPLVWASPGPAQSWPRRFLDGFDCERLGPCVTCGNACLSARGSPGGGTPLAVTWRC